MKQAHNTARDVLTFENSQEDPGEPWSPARIVGNWFRRDGGILPGVPIGIRSVGHIRANRGLYRGIPEPDAVGVVWSVAGRARQLRSERWLPFGPGRAFIKLEAEPERMRIRSDRYEMCWITLDGPLALSCARLLGLRRGLFHPGPCPRDLFGRILRAARDTSLAGQRQAGLLGQHLLHQLANGVRAEPTPELVDGAKYIIHIDFRDPMLSVANIASRMHCHRTTLARAFRRTMGMTPLDYLQSVRLQHATTMLSTTRLPVAKIARRTGFTSAAYFAAWHRKQTGRRPSEVREGNSEDRDERPVLE